MLSVDDGVETACDCVGPQLVTDAVIAEPEEIYPHYFGRNRSLSS